VKVTTVGPYDLSQLITQTGKITDISKITNVVVSIAKIVSLLSHLKIPPY